MSWKSVLGHDDNHDRLAAAFHKNRLAHAYLFVGPEGIGKRRFAIEFAKALLCERNGGKWDACDHCPACTQVDSLTHPDFLTTKKPEDKQEFPIDAIREFLPLLGLKPARGSRKIAIIDDADDFNEESGNCLLKTLEEPPPGSILILLGTSTDLQLSTIISRCQILRFRPLNARDLLACLQMQGLKDIPDGDVLHRLCHGSPGKAIAVIEGKLWEFRDALIDHLVSQQFRGTRLIEPMLKKVEEAGKESKYQRERAIVLIGVIIDLLRNVFQATLGVLQENDPREIGRLTAVAQVWNEDDCISAMEACSEAIRFVERRAPVPVVIEQLVDRLASRTV